MDFSWILDTIWGVLGRLLGALGRILGAFGKLYATFETSWASWMPLKRFGVDLGSIWGGLGVLLKVFLGYLWGTFEVLLGSMSLVFEYIFNVYEH